MSLAEAAPRRDQCVESTRDARQRGVACVGRNPHPASGVREDARRDSAQVGVMTDEEN